MCNLVVPEPLLALDALFVREPISNSGRGPPSSAFAPWANYQSVCLNNVQCTYSTHTCGVVEMFVVVNVAMT